MPPGRRSSWRLADGCSTCPLRGHAGDFNISAGLPQLFVLSSIQRTLLCQASVLELPLWGLISLLPGLRLDSDFPLTASDALDHPWLLPPAEQLQLAILVLPAVQVHPAGQRSMDACVISSGAYCRGLQLG